MQSMVASFIRQTISDINYSRELFTFRDGGIVGLDWMETVDDGPAQPIVLFLPGSCSILFQITTITTTMSSGITGSSQSEYIKALVNTACKERARCVVFNFRGRGGLGLKSPRTYCAANSDDLSEILNHLKLRYPRAPVLGVGISLGNSID